MAIRADRREGTIRIRIDEGTSVPAPLQHALDTYAHREVVAPSVRLALYTIRAYDYRCYLRDLVEAAATAAPVHKAGTATVAGHRHTASGWVCVGCGGPVSVYGERYCEECRH